MLLSRVVRRYRSAPRCLSPGQEGLELTRPQRPIRALGQTLRSRISDPFHDSGWKRHSPKGGVEDGESKYCIEVTERVPNRLAEHELGSIGRCGVHVSHSVSPSQVQFKTGRP